MANGLSERVLVTFGNITKSRYLIIFNDDRIEAVLSVGAF